MMLWYAYLPLLALPTAVDAMRLGDTCDPPAGSPRLAFSYNTNNCTGEKIATGFLEGSSMSSEDATYDGTNMDNKVCTQQTSEKSIQPGMKDQVPGLYCLLAYDDSECNCVTSWLKYNFTENIDPGCVKLDTLPYSYHRWHRTCDEFPDCPQGCYDPEQ